MKRPTQPITTPQLVFHEPKEIRLGCYMVNVKMKGYLSNGNQFDGTIRVDWGDETSTETLPQIKLASGDLYQRKYRFAQTRKSFRPSLFESKSTKTVNYSVGPTPSADVPIFHTEQYKYYIRVIDITQGKTRTNACSIKFQLWEFGEWGSLPTWTKVRTVIAKMEWKLAPDGYPSSDDYLEGTLHDYKSNETVGEMSMGWVSEFLRKGILQIDKEAGTNTILNNGETGDLLETWQSIGEKFKWKIEVDPTIGVISKSDKGSPWRDEDLERELNRVRKSWHSGTEWRYHLSIVKSYDYADSDSTPKLYAGNLYEVESRNFDPVTIIGQHRAGFVVATDWVFDKLVYGSLQGQKIKTIPKLLFRTAVHEFGHHLSLIHNDSDTNLMNVTEDIADKGTPANPFPNNINWEFDAVEKMRLKHGSDLYVRPLGIDFTEIYPSTDPFYQAY